MRRHSEEDRREVLVELTPHGEHLLRMLSVLHWEELQNFGPALSETLQAVVHNTTEERRKLI